MSTTTLGVKLDDASRERLKAPARRIDRTPHWVIKQAIFNYQEQLERGEGPVWAVSNPYAGVVGAGGQGASSWRCLTRLFSSYSKDSDRKNAIFAHIFSNDHNT